MPFAVAPDRAGKSRPSGWFFRRSARVVSPALLVLAAFVPSIAWAQVPPPPPLNGIAIAVPEDGATVSRKILVRAVTGSSQRILAVEFRLDGATFAVDSTAPYSTTLDTQLYANGPHVLTAQAATSRGEIFRHITSININNALPAVLPNLVANPPVATQRFISPPSYISAMEGDVLALPIAVDDPNDALNTYTAQYVLNGVAGPLLYNQTLDTAKCQLHWWTTIGQAGTHIIRLHAADTVGATADLDVTVTIRPRQAANGPIVRVRPSTNAPTSSYYPDGSVVEVQEGSPQVMLRVDLTPSVGGTGPVTLSAIGLPLGLTSGPGSFTNVYSIAGYPDYSSSGLHDITLVAVDKAGRWSQYRFQILVRDVVQSQEVNFLVPIINGAPQVTTVLAHYLLPMPTLAGVVQLKTIIADKGSVPVTPAPIGVKVVYRIDDVVVSPPLSPDAAFNWNSTTVPDGTHAINVDLVDSDQDPHRFQSRIVPVAVENTANPPRADQPQLLPALAPSFRQIFGSQRIDRVQYNGMLTGITTHTIPYAPSVAPLTDPERLTLRNESQWFAVPILHNSPGLYRPEPRFYRARSTLAPNDALRDKVLIHPQYARGGTSSEGAIADNDRLDWWCGTRGNASVSPYSSFVPNPASTGFLGIDISGRLFRLNLDGSMVTLAGIVNHRAQPGVTILPPYLYTDTAIPWNSIIAADKDLIGNFNGLYFNVADDLAVAPGNPNIIYIADMYNDRIAKVDLTGSTTALVNPGTGTPQITTFVGAVNAPNKYVDGPLATARFHKPTSLVFDAAGNLLVADRDNCAIRKIILNGSGAGTVVTVAGGTLAGTVRPAEGGIDPSLYPPHVPGGNPLLTTHNWIYYPQCVRVNSQGHIIVGENLTKAVKDVDPVSGVVRLVRTHLLETTALNDWTWIEVDKDGLVGPRDDIFVPLVNGQGNAFIWRMSATGAFSGEFLNFHGVFSSGNGALCVPDLGRHYPWTVVIDDQESLLMTTGMGSTGPILIRRTRPGIDPSQNDQAAYTSGEAIHWSGTVGRFPFNSRPSFVATHGPLGYTRFGTVPNFDDYAAQYLADTATLGAPAAYANLGNQIRSGFGGVVPRPELGGRDLRDYVYYVLRNSIYATTTTFTIPDPAPNNHLPEIRRLVVNRDPEPTAPGYEKVMVTWWTDEPTIGCVTISPDAINMVSRMYDVENVAAPTTLHMLTLRFVPTAKDFAFTLTVKNDYGNVTTRTF